MSTVKILYSLYQAKGADSTYSDKNSVVICLHFATIPRRAVSADIAG